MNKKNYILTIVLALFVSFNLFSQERESRKKIKSLKISFITDKLALTSQEASKFWPIYNKYEIERNDLYHVQRGDLKKKIEELGGIDNLKEEDAKNFAEKMLSLDKATYDSNVTYQEELSKVISYKKIVKLQIVERDFYNSLMKRFKNQRATRNTKEN
jgi:hypothetical protein